jgi:hypothetical protein
MNKSQKIFDILPPDQAGFKRGANIFKNKPEAALSLASAKKTGAKPHIFKTILFLFLLVGIAFFLVSNFLFDNAKILIWPETDSIDLKEKVTAAVGQKDIDVSGKNIPAEIFEEEKTVFQEFPSSGTAVKSENARGTIRIYNNYSDTTQILLAGTRFVSADGKLFRTTERIVVPGGKYEKGKLQPGYIDAVAVADKPGPDYNIGPTTFSIPGFVGTPKYTAFYGKSFGDMAGGAKSEFSQVTKEDLDNAKKVLTDKILADNRNSMKDKIPPDYIFSDQTLSLEIINATSTVGAGGEAKNFIYQIKAKMKAIIIKKTGLEDISKSIILSNFPEGKNVQEESLKIIWEIYSMDLKGGTVVLNLDLAAKVYTDIKEIQLRNALLGKPLIEVKQLLLDRPEIIKSQIKIWPFWMKAIPDDEKKVKVSLIFDSAGR